MMKIDYFKLFEQEAEFRQFYKDATSGIDEVLSVDKIELVHNFYLDGVDVEAVRMVLKFIKATRGELWADR